MNRIKVVFYFMMIITQSLFSEQSKVAEGNGDYLVCESEIKVNLPENANANLFMEKLAEYNLFSLCWDHYNNRVFFRVDTDKVLQVVRDIQQREVHGFFIACYDENGNHLFNFAEENNGKKGNMLSCSNMQYYEGSVYALDNNKDRIMEYKVGDKVKFERLIDREHKITGTNFAINGDKIAVAGNKGFMVENFWAANIYNIIDDEEFPEASLLGDKRNILDLEEKWNESHFDEILSNPMQKVSIDWAEMDNMTKSIYTGIFTGGLFYYSQFVWINNEELYGLNPWGTCLCKYDKDGSLNETNQLELLAEYRNEELERMRIDFKMEDPHVIFSVPRYLFYDSAHNNLLIFYLFSHNEQAEYGFKNRMQLLVYSLDSNEEISPLIDIDFSPAGVDEGEIIGLKTAENEIFLSKYSLDLK